MKIHARKEPLSCWAPRKDVEEEEDNEEEDLDDVDDVDLDVVKYGKANNKPPSYLWLVYCHPFLWELSLGIFIHVLLTSPAK